MNNSIMQEGNNYLRVIFIFLFLMFSFINSFVGIKEDFDPGVEAARADNYDGAISLFSKAIDSGNIRDEN